jgi:serine/threonine protein kinase
VTLDSDTSLAHGLGGDDGQTPEPGPFVSADDADEHDDDFDTMDSLLAAVAAAPAVPLDRTEGVGIPEDTVVDGTYRVLRRLGGGGMGIVYLAEHTELQRQVALKLHLGAIDSHELQRLRREARVMAQLSHPNVLVVHDVGTHQGRMFFAMEHAEGGTLKAWLEAGPRPWREILAMLVQAGRGLAAAHRVGVVHRDFKPDNVLLGADGRPRVADFGLARRWDEPREVTKGASSTRMDDAHHLTATGAVVGTPAYMSPEQFADGEVGPASDQFAFCVVLYEALVGRRPFAAARWTEQLLAFERGPAIPPRRSMPRSLWRVIRRGLALAAQDRWPTMDALLAALLAVPRRRRVVATAALVLPLAGLLVVAGRASSTSEPEPDPCEQILGALDESWNPARGEALYRAFEATALPFASTSADAAREGLDHWSATWLSERQQLCRATASAEAPAEVLGLRGACLDQQRTHFDATVEVLLGADAQTVTRAQDQLAHLAQLASPAACRDDRLLLLGVQPPPAHQAEAVAELRRTLARSQAERLAGHPGVAQELVTPTVAAAEALGHRPVLAEALTEAGEVMLDLADRHEQGLALLERAVDLAEASHHDGLAARIWLDLTFEAANALRDEARGRSQLRRAEAANERVGISALTRARLAILHGKLEQLAGHGDVAETALRAALAELDEADETPARLVRPAVLGHLAQLVAELCRRDEALALRREALRAAQAGYGPAHPNVAPYAFALGQALQAARRDEEAIAPLEQAAALWLAGPHVPDAELGVALLSLTQVALASGELEAAERRANDAAAVFARSLPPVHQRHGDASLAVAVIAGQRGDHEAALQHFERAVEHYERSLGPQASLVADAQVNAGVTLLELQRFDEARTRFQAALGSPHPGPHVAVARLGLTLAALHQGDAAAAQAQLDAAATPREGLDDSDRLELELLERITRLRAGLHPGPCSPPLRAAFDEPSHADHEHVEWIARLVALSAAERRALALPTAPAPGP